MWNCANLSRLFSKMLQPEYESVVCHRQPSDDPFRQTDENMVWLGWENFEDKVIDYAKGFDIVHVHILYWLVPRLRERYPDTKIVVHHHGNNLREDGGKAQRDSRDADLVLYSTPDLKLYLDADAQYLPNPVDEERFHPISLMHPDRTIYPQAYIKYRGCVPAILERFPKCYIWRRYEKPLDHAQIPAFLSLWGEYVEWKPDVEYERVEDRMVLSVNALEALRLGLKVYYWPWDTWTLRFPEEHRWEKVKRRLLRLYGELG